MSTKKFFNTPISFQRMIAQFFTGLPGATNALSHSGRAAKVVINNLNTNAADLTFIGHRAGNTVFANKTLSGLDKNVELSTIFDDLVQFNSVHTNQPNLVISLVTPQGEPVRRQVSVLDEKCNVLYRKRYSPQEVDAPGTVETSEILIIAPRAGATVSIGDFFSLNQKSYKVSRVDPINSIGTGGRTHHFEFICNQTR